MGATYEVSAPVQSQWEGIYHPDFDYIPSLEDIRKRIFSLTGLPSACGSSKFLARRQHKLR